MSAELPPGIRVRPATDADLPKLERLLESGQLSSRNVADHISEFFVADVQGEVVASIGLEQLDEYALLRSTCVDPTWQRHGVASALVERALTEAALEAIDSVYLLTETADRFFARFGFMRIPQSELPLPVTRSVARAGYCPSTATAMRLRLAQP